MYPYMKYSGKILQSYKIQYSFKPVHAPMWNAVLVPVPKYEPTCNFSYELYVGSSTKVDMAI